jgi:D-alanyl-D-alanine carboxypeptidase
MRFGTLLLAVSLFAQTTIPDTPAGRVFGKWLESFNSGDRAQIEAFLKVHNPPRLQKIDETLEFRQETGGFELLQIEKSSPQVLRGRVKEKKSDTVAVFELHVSESDPPLIENFMMRAGPGAEEAGPPPQRVGQQEALQALEQEAAKRAANDRFSGTLLVARNGEIILEKAYGLADREKNAPNTLDTQFRLGSMNKMFTAVAVLQLVSKGKLALDDPLIKYFPDYPNKDLAQKVTVRQLLTHSGGTGDIFGPEFDKNRLQLKTLSEYAKLYGARGVKFEPGSRWEYSNYGFLLLGLLVEKVSGQSYYDYVRDNIFKPAGMTATDSLPESEAVAHRATGYMKQQGKWVNNADTLPYRGTSAGGGYSTVRDLLRFSQALSSGKILPAKYLEMATSTQFKNPDAPPGVGYGFGFMVMGEAFGHGGGAPGMNGELRMNFKSGLTIVVLSNLDPPAASNLLKFYEDRRPIS